MANVVERTFKFNIDAGNVQSQVKIIQEAIKGLGEIKKTLADGIVIEFKPGSLDEITKRLEELRSTGVSVDVKFNVDPDKSLDSALENIRTKTASITGNIERSIASIGELIRIAGAGLSTLADTRNLNIGIDEQALVKRVTGAVKSAVTTANGVDAKIKSLEVPLKAGRLTYQSIEDAIKEVREQAKSGRFSIPITTSFSDTPASMSRSIRKLIRDTNAAINQSEGMNAVVIPTKLRSISVPEIKAAIQGINNILANEEYQANVKAKVTVDTAASKGIIAVADAAGIAANTFVDLQQQIQNFAQSATADMTGLRDLMQEIERAAKNIEAVSITIRHRTAASGGGTSSKSAKSEQRKEEKEREETENQRLARLNKESALLTKLKKQQDSLNRVRENGYVDTSQLEGFDRVSTELSNAIQKIEGANLPVKELKQIDADTKDIGREVSNIVKDANALSKVAKDQETALNKVAEVQVKLNNINTGGFFEKESIAGYSEAMQKISSLSAELSSGVSDPGRMKTIQQEIKNVTKDVGALEQAAKGMVKEAQAAERAAEKAANSTGKNVANLLRVIGRYVQSDPMFKVSDSVLKSYFLGTDEEYKALATARDEILKLQQQIAALEGEISDSEMQGWLDKFAKLRDKLQRLQSRTDKTPLFGQEFAFLDKDAVDKAVKGYEEIKKRILDDNAVVKPKQLQWKIVEEGEIAKLTASFVDQTGKLRTLSYEYDNANGKLKNLTKTEAQGLSFMERLNRMFKQRGEALVAYLGTFASFYRIIGTFREGFNIIKQLDTNMTELRRVSGATESALDSFRNTVFETGREIGTTGDNIIKLAADYARLGYSLNEARELASSTAMYMNVGFIDDANFAMESLTSTMKAYGMEASEVSSIVDKFNEVGKLLPLNGYIGQRVGTPETEQRLNMLPQCA